MSTESIPGQQIQPVEQLSTPVSPGEGRQLSGWMYEMIRPYVKGKILELGSSNGDIAEHFISARLPLRLSDPDGESCRKLREKFEGQPIVKGVHQIDPAHGTFDLAYEKYLGQFDTVLLLNAIEGIPDNSEVLVNLKKLVRQDGHLIVQLPARIVLYEQTEEDLDYWKECSRRDLRKRIGKDFEYLKARFFKIYEQLPTDGDPVDSYQQLISYFSKTNNNMFQRMGLSLIGIERKI